MEKSPFNREQELQILKAFDEMDKDLGIDKLDDEAGLQSIFQKFQETDSKTQALRSEGLSTLRSTQKKIASEVPRRGAPERSFGWKSISASIVSAFSLGAIVANFALVPTVAVSTRSVVEDPSTAGVLMAHDQFKILDLGGVNRHLFVKEVLGAASQSDLLVTVQQRDERLILKVGDFRPLSKEQEKVRELFQLGSSFSGQLEVEIR
jgi:hypothetical protein